MFCFEYTITSEDRSIMIDGMIKVGSSSEVTALAIVYDLIKKMTPLGMKWELRSCKCTYKSDIG